MVLRICGALFGLVLVVQPVLADSLDLNIHTDAMRVTYARAIGQAERGLEFDAGLLYAKNPGETDNLVHAGLMVAGQNWSHQGNFDISLGGRVVAADIKAGNVLGMAIGGRVRFSPVNRFGIGGQLFYAPKITSFLDSEEYTEWGVAADYQLLTQAFVYVGYRRVEVKIKDKGTAQIDDNLHLGMKLLF